MLDLKSFLLKRWVISPTFNPGHPVYFPNFTIELGHLSTTNDSTLPQISYNILKNLCFKLLCKDTTLKTKKQAFLKKNKSFFKKNKNIGRLTCLSLSGLLVHSTCNRMSSFCYVFGRNQIAQPLTLALFRIWGSWGSRHATLYFNMLSIF